MQKLLIAQFRAEANHHFLHPYHDEAEKLCDRIASSTGKNPRLRHTPNLRSQTLSITWRNIFVHYVERAGH